MPSISAIKSYLPLKPAYLVTLAPTDAANADVAAFLSVDGLLTNPPRPFAVYLPRVINFAITSPLSYFSTITVPE